MRQARCRDTRVGPWLLCGLVVAMLLCASPAAAAQRTYVMRAGPFPMAAFNTSLPKMFVPAPKVDGYLVRMHARLVDRRGRAVSIRDVMLHHTVWRRQWRPKRPLPCTSRFGEAFYGTGEEDQSLVLPPGYGYRIRKDDRWRMNAMLMSHSTRAFDVYVQYTVTVETKKRLTPVHAFWLRANGCGPSMSYGVMGGGGPGSTHVMSSEWRAPYGMRIVAAGGHLHGGSKRMFLSQPRCGNRELLNNDPYYGMPDHIYYRARPILHEPGPVDTSYFVSRAGIPVRKGETLRTTGLYDGERPHGGAMAVMHVYVAADRRPPAGCAPLPADAKQVRKPGPLRTEPPRVDVPLTGLDARGRTFSIVDPPWPVRPISAGDTVEVGARGFSPRRVSVPAGTILTWRFHDPAAHNVRLANGPHLVGTPTLRKGESARSLFPVPGRYELFCSLHPVTMHQIVEVAPGT